MERLFVVTYIRDKQEYKWVAGARSKFDAKKKFWHEITIMGIDADDIVIQHILEQD